MFGGSGFAESGFCSSLSEFFVVINGYGRVEVSFEFTIYSATREFATRPDDTLANQPFAGTLKLPLNFRRSIIDEDIGTFTTGKGRLQIDNSDGQYDFLIQQYAIDGRQVIVKVGREITSLNDESYDDYFIVFSGTARDWEINEEIVDLIINDNSYKLEVPAQLSLYGGTGGVDGGDDLKGKRKPRAFGYLSNVSPPLIVPSLLIYQVNDGPVAVVTFVYDRGSALTYYGNHTNYANLAAAVIPGGGWMSCLAEGLFRLADQPVGTVTCDLAGDSSSSGFVATAGEIVTRLLLSSTALTIADLYVASFSSIFVEQPAPVGYWIAPDDTSSIADVIADIMHGIGGWGGFRRNGKFEVRRFLTPTGTPVMVLDDVDIRSMRREALPSGLTPSPWRQRVAHSYNWTVQTDLAGAVGATRKAFVSEQYRLAEASDEDIRLDHPFAQDPRPVVAFFRDQADAQVEADRRLDLYRGAKALYRMVLPITALRLNLGDVIEVTYPRWDLTTGRLLRIVEMTDNLSYESGNEVEVVAYG